MPQPLHYSPSLDFEPEPNQLKQYQFLYKSIRSRQQTPQLSSSKIHKNQRFIINTMIDDVINLVDRPSKKVFGSLKMNYVMHVYIPLAILTPCYTYYMAVDKHHEVKPFPHSTVTMTAQHYPQNIVFRYIMGIASTILVLAFNTIFRWINYQAERSGYRRRMSKGIYYMVMFAMVTYCTAIETIDGAGNGPLHTPSAIIFFLAWEIAIIYITLFVYRLREWDSSIMTPNSMKLKGILAVYVTLVWIYCLYGTYGKAQNSLDYTVIVEWNAVFVNLLWALSFTIEWKDIKLSLIGPA